MNKQTETTNFVIKGNSLKKFLSENLSDCSSNPHPNTIKDGSFTNMDENGFMAPFFLLRDILYIKRTDDFPVGSKILITFNYCAEEREKFNSKSNHYLQYEYTYEVLPYDSMNNEMRLVGFDVIPVIENKELCLQREP